MMKALSSLTGAALVAVPLVAAITARAQAPVAVPPSPLTSKKTIRTKATFSVMNSRENKFTPFFDVTVTLDGKSRYRIDATPLAATTKEPSFYFSDGTKQYEYNSLVKQYDTADAPKPGQRYLSQLAAMAGLELLRTPNAPPRPTVTRTTSEVMLDGKKAIVVNDEETARKTPDGKTLVPYTRVWLDAATGLPLRKVEGMTLDGADRPNLQINFESWTFDAPVPAKTFAWTVPAGAKSREEASALLPVGQTAPDFTAYTPDGKPVKLSDYKGKVVILDFWATWCGPCQKSMPHLDKVYSQVKDKNVAVLAVCVWDEKAEYDKWVTVKKGTYSFPTVFDPAGRGKNNIAGGLYKVTGIPTQYIIDKEGKIAASTIGYSENDSFLERSLARLGVPVPAAVPVKTAANAAP